MGGGLMGHEGVQMMMMMMGIQLILVLGFRL
jgi:hypothetical protein